MQFTPLWILVVTAFSLKECIKTSKFEQFYRRVLFISIDQCDLHFNLVNNNNKKTAFIGNSEIPPFYVVQQ